MGEGDGDDGITNGARAPADAAAACVPEGASDKSQLPLLLGVSPPTACKPCCGCCSGAKRPGLPAAGNIVSATTASPLSACLNRPAIAGDGARCVSDCSHGEKGLLAPQPAAGDAAAERPKGWRAVISTCCCCCLPAAPSSA
jgi:hypothetical protein